MITKTLICKVDITRRCASEVCSAFNKVPNGSAIYLKKQGESRTCNAKSLLGLLSLVLREGDVCELILNADLEYFNFDLISEYFDVVD